jgi:O-antigen biosynthesis protein
MKRSTPGQLPAARSARIVDGKVSIIVLNWNARPFLTRCLDSIVRYTRQPYELIIVDNGSDDGSPEVVERMVRTHSDVDITFLHNAENRYFSHGYNQGFAASATDAEYVMVFCNDVEAKEDGWLGDFLAAIRAPNVIAVGSGATSRVSDEQREIFRRNNPRYPTPGLTRRMRRCIDDPTFAFTHIYGYCFLLNKSLLTRTGLYLEGGDFRQYHSDWEWYVRFKVLGYDSGLITPRVHHWHSVSELIAFHPHRYQDLVEQLAQPQLVERYLRQGRPLYEEESGYREVQRQAREAGGRTRGR